MPKIKIKKKIKKIILLNIEKQWVPCKCTGEEVSWSFHGHTIPEGFHWQNQKLELRYMSP